MRILMIGFTKLKYMPYMNFYLEQLLDVGVDIDLVYWNRDLKSDISIDSKIKKFEFKSFQEDEVSRISKLANFHKFRKFAKRVMSETNYDMVIAMHTIPAILLYYQLVFKKTKFILDYRDVTFERNYLFRKAVNGLIDNSEVSFTSSDAFRTYFNNNDKVVTTHNILKDIMISNSSTSNSVKKELNPNRIIVRYWGFIRHEEINLKVIDQFAEDDRFELHYHGREQQTAINLKKHVDSKGYKNIFFHGEYNPDERLVFLLKTDVVHNVFENDATMGPALSNKFYDAVFYSIPQICTEGTHMGKFVDDHNIGFSWNLEENLPENLHNYLMINNIKNNSSYQKVKDNLINEYNSAARALRVIINANTQ